MPITIILAALAVCLSVPILWLTLSAGRVPGGDRVSRNLAAGFAPTDLRRLVLSQSRTERALQPLIRAFAGRARRISPAGMVSALERRIELAGLSWQLEHVLGAKVALAIVGAVGGVLGGAALGLGTAGLALGAMGLAIGYLVLDSVLYHKARSRQGAILIALPDTLDQLTICVEAGLGFDAALQRVGHVGEGPLADEMRQLIQELRMGIPRSDALNNLLGRTDVAELRQFVHSVFQAEIYGVPVSNALRSQAYEAREKRRQVAEERAMKLPVKLVFPLVFCILPTLFIVVLGPSVIRVIEQFTKA